MKQSKNNLNPRRVFIFKSLKKASDLKETNPTDQTSTTINSTVTSGILISGGPF